MACATLSLKRNHDFDHLHSPSSRSPKRRRCMPMTISPQTPPTKLHQTTSVFKDISPKLSREHIAKNLAAEIKRMHRRKQLTFPSDSAISPSTSGGTLPQLHMDGNDSDDNNSDSSCSSSKSQTNFFNALSPSKKEVPLFTFRQVSMFCERMLKDQEEKIRENYDKVLGCKLSEQYEAFLRFNHDQIQRRFNETPASYVS
ncbi:akirin-2-like [Tubulanus polymorphus]|uniref:akirin-2-like n=1 Tax=Tubulanus polymorphus TaxID=672921 RepID=UPI003DA5DF20